MTTFPNDKSESLLAPRIPLQMLARGQNPGMVQERVRYRCCAKHRAPTEGWSGPLGQRNLGGHVPDRNAAAYCKGPEFEGGESVLECCDLSQLSFSDGAHSASERGPAKSDERNRKR